MMFVFRILHDSFVNAMNHTVRERRYRSPMQRGVACCIFNIQQMADVIGCDKGVIAPIYSDLTC